MTFGLVRFRGSGADVLEDVLVCGFLCGRTGESTEITSFSSALLDDGTTVTSEGSGNASMSMTSASTLGVFFSFPFCCIAGQVRQAGLDGRLLDSLRGTCSVVSK